MSDGLTGLLNHRVFQRHLAALVETATPFSLLLTDLDGFKMVNELTGHARGDEMLKRTAAALIAVAPDHDAVFRYGGDEFTILLPGVDEAAAVDLAERVCAAIVAIEVPGWNVPKKPAPQHLTCSVGVACYPADGTTAEGVVIAADRAMYAAKVVGGGTVRTARSRP